MTEIIVRMEGNGQLTPVTEIVRCKDCKKHGEYECHITALTGQISSDDWFCADGERKDGEKDGL